MIPSRHATKEEILLVHSDEFFGYLEKTKTASKEEMAKLSGKARSIEYSNVSETA